MNVHDLNTFSRFRLKLQSTQLKTKEEKKSLMGPNLTPTNENGQSFCLRLKSSVSSLFSALHRRQSEDKIMCFQVLAETLNKNTPYNHFSLQTNENTNASD